MRNIVIFLITIIALSVLLTACEGGLTGKVTGYCRISLYEDKTCSSCDNAGECGAFCEGHCLSKGGSVVRVTGQTETNTYGAERILCDCECKIC